MPSLILVRVHRLQRLLSNLTILL